MRESEVQRKTRETTITARLNLDGSGRVDIQTGVGFFDHMLGAAMVHGFFDLTLSAEGDLDVDGHHTVEDVGIVLGRALADALGDYGGIKRFGFAAAPMDEALAQATVDLSRRPYLVLNVPTPLPERIGGFETQLLEEFWRGFAVHGGATLHIDVIRGVNGHHILEAIFKAVGRALDAATSEDRRLAGALSTKGRL
jgi:imidazoleglycerol-phosphate dehydratase